MIKKAGRKFKDQVPKKEYFGKALYTFDIGQNDLGQGFFSNMSIEEVKASIPDIVNRFSNNVKNVYKLGARSFWIHNTGPIGCLPYILSSFPIRSDEMDSAGCVRPYNEISTLPSTLSSLNQKNTDLSSRLSLAVALAGDITITVILD
ncbi:hypothetical protein F0562_027981 [Nyssa sinensis]|uniref:GDSL esterase/lipase n=1 Tax=Nyssa sinensis TaxID=561372 RepID=A0A5J5B5H8_9ASTE|nr:hypothetical protein F0562_027981 [Nyssa sinensis]